MPDNKRHYTVGDLRATLAREAGKSDKLDAYPVIVHVRQGDEQIVMAYVTRVEVVDESLPDGVGGMDINNTGTVVSIQADLKDLADSPTSE